MAVFIDTELAKIRYCPVCGRPFVPNNFNAIISCEDCFGLNAFDPVPLYLRETDSVRQAREIIKQHYYLGIR